MDRIILSLFILLNVGCSSNNQKEEISKNIDEINKDTLSVEKISVTSVQNSNKTWLFSHTDNYFQKILNNPNNTGYILNLEKCISLLLQNEIVNENDLLECIPSSQEQFSIYFHCDYEKGGIHKYWNKLDEIMYNKSKTSSRVFFSVLNISDFVDGYYAESYFENVENLIKDYHKKEFCEMYDTLNSNIKSKLSYFYEEYCTNNYKQKKNGKR
ncbi:MAG: hypothetical protein LBO06_06730 [Bacteroidales bacterium]|jgi:hypothetical protein|nr:hypothetical protein [Bacteroidales bacterium]